MVNYECKIVVPLNKEAYWKIIFSDEFDTFAAPYLKFKKIEIEHDTACTEPNILKRRVKVYPDYSIPSALLWYLGQTEFHYIDVQQRDETKQEIISHTIPPVHEDYLKISTRQFFEPIDDNSCTHIMQIEVTCSAWGIGTIVESAIVSGVEEGYGLLPKALEAFLASKAGTSN